MSTNATVIPSGLLALPPPHQAGSFLLGNEYAVRLVSPIGSVGTLAGRPYYGFSDGVGSEAMFNHIWGMLQTPNSSTSVWLSDKDNNRIREVNLVTREVTTLYGDGYGYPFVGRYLDGFGTSCSFYWPRGLASLKGVVYIADSSNNRVRVINPDGFVGSLAGSFFPLTIDGQGTAASFNEPFGLTADGTHLFVSERAGRVIRRLTTGGVVTTLPVAPPGVQLVSPLSLSADPLSGALYVADNCPDDNHIFAQRSVHVIELSCLPPSSGTPAPPAAIPLPWYAALLAALGAAGVVCALFFPWRKSLGPCAGGAGDFPPATGPLPPNHSLALSPIVELSEFNFFSLPLDQASLFFPSSFPSSESPPTTPLLEPQGPQLVPHQGSLRMLYFSGGASLGDGDDFVCGVSTSSKE
jgi:hypothetical protein